MSDDAPPWAQDVIRSLGQIEGKIDAYSLAFATHVAEDKVTAGHVQDIQLDLARQRGAATTWGIVATAAASVVGASVHFLGKKFGW